MLALPETSAQLLAGLEQHRQLTTNQLRAIYAPEHSYQWVRRQARLLYRRRLATYSDRGSSHHRCWYLTRLGAEVTGSSRKAMTDDRAAGPLQGHTLAVNEVGIAFLQAARRRGDVFGAEDWRHEVTHPFKGRMGFLRADAILDYQSGEELRLSFVELDNGTEQVRRVVDQLGDYGRYRRAAGWEKHYRSFPGILVVLAGRPRPFLENRLRVLRAWTEQEPEIRAAGLSISFALLEDLMLLGPFEPIFRQPGRRERVNWLGEVCEPFEVIRA